MSCSYFYDIITSVEILHIEKTNFAIVIINPLIFLLYSTSTKKLICDTLKLDFQIQMQIQMQIHMDNDGCD